MYGLWAVFHREPSVAQGCARPVHMGANVCSLVTPIVLATIPTFAGLWLNSFACQRYKIEPHRDGYSNTFVSGGSLAS